MQTSGNPLGFRSSAAERGTRNYRLSEVLRGVQKKVLHISFHQFILQLRSGTRKWSLSGTFWYFFDSGPFSVPFRFLLDIANFHHTS